MFQARLPLKAEANPPAECVHLAERSLRLTWIKVAYSNVEYMPGSARFKTSWRSSNRRSSVVLEGGFQLPLATGYSYTRATRANGMTSAAQYQQFNRSEYFSLSKRTGPYALQAFQRAYGNTLGTPGAASVINATPSIGDGFQSAPLSSHSHHAAGVGIIHRF